MKKSKKATLLLAVMGINSLPSVMDNSLGGGALWSVNRAEAADEEVHALTDAERIEKGYPAIPGLTYYSDGTVYKEFPEAGAWNGYLERGRIIKWCIGMILNYIFIYKKIFSNFY